MELIEIQLIICIQVYLANNNQARLICHKTQSTNDVSFLNFFQYYIYIYIYIYIYMRGYEKTFTMRPILYSQHLLVECCKADTPTQIITNTYQYGSRYS